MSFEIVEKSQVNREITLTIAGSDVRSTEGRMVEAARRQMVIKGFRKGKVPASIVRERVGAAILEDARGECVQKAAREALSTLGDLLHVGDVQIVAEKTEDGGFVARLHAECTPKVELRPYKGLEIRVADVKVTDEDVAEAMNTRRERHSELKTVEGRDTVEEGDVVLCALTAPNDAASKLCRPGDRNITVGRGDINADMEKCLVGAKVGDAVQMTAKIGEDEPVVTAEVKEIKIRVIPELNDDFAKLTGEAQTLDKLREVTRKTLVEEEENRRKSEIDAKLMKKLCELMPIEIPEGYVKTRAVQAVRLQLEQWMGKQVDDAWCDRIAANMKDEEIEAYRKDYNVEIVLNAISDDAKIEVSHEEIIDEAMKWFQHGTKDRIERWLKTNNAEQFVGNQVRRDRALDIVREAAVITPMTDEEIAAEKEAVKV